MMDSIGDKILGPWDPSIIKCAREKPLAIGPCRSAGGEGKRLPESTRPRTNPATPGPGSGVAEPDRVPRVPRKNHSSGSLAWSETGPS